MREKRSWFVGVVLGLGENGVSEWVVFSFLFKSWLGAKMMGLRLEG